MSSTAKEFDWHITPSDRFTYESNFQKFGKDELSLLELESLFQASRLAQEEFVQIWALVSLSAPTINEEQFIYFKHLLESRRKGRPIPHGVPLDVKERFLKSKPESKLYTRTVLGARDPGGSHQKDLPQLQRDLEAVESELEVQETKRQETDDKLTSATLARDEFVGLAAHHKRHLEAVRADVIVLRDGLKTVEASGVGHSNSSSSTTQGAEGLLKQANDVIRDLQAEKDKLASLQASLQRELDGLV